jgi:hypothetical protein
VVVLLGALGLGWLLLVLLTFQHKAPIGNIVEVGVLSLTLGILVLGWVAVVLAEAGYFSLTVLAVFWAISVLTLAVILYRRKIRIRLDTVAIKRTELVFLGGWLIVACCLFFRPHQRIIGGADAGVYVNLGSNIARSGRILIHDQALAKLDPSLYPVFLREYPDEKPVPYYLFPGFYVPGEPVGLVIPQFYPLHPVWLSVFFSLGGIKADLLGTPFWALLGSLSVYLAVRQMFGWKAALLALGTLTITAMQVWFARYPTTEMLTQYLFWMGGYAFAAWLSGRRPAHLWALVAGASLGEVFLTRIDMYFLLAIPLLLGLWLRWSVKRPKGSVWFLVTVFALAAHSLIHGLFFSWPYFNNLYEYGLWLIRRYLLIPILLTLAGAGVLIVMDRKPRLRKWGVQMWAAWRVPLLSLVTASVIILAVYGYWIRPALGGDSTAHAYWYGGGEIPADLDRENLVRLGWYISPLGLALAVSGICLSLWKLDRRIALFLGSGLFFSLLYLWRIQANPRQIYAMRRYMPIVLPFFIVSAAYFLTWLYARPVRWQKWTGMFVGVVWIVSLAWLARGFVSQVDCRGAVTQIDDLNTRLVPNSVLIFDDQAPVGQGDFLGTPLHFLYGHDVFSLRRPELVRERQLEQQIERWRTEGREVYWMGVPQNTQALGDYTLEYQGDYQTSLVALEASYKARPWRHITIEWGGEINRVVDPTNRQ